MSSGNDHASSGEPMKERQEGIADASVLTKLGTIDVTRVIV
jgi:hypothetical protein